jgi:CRISPR-associated endonuclease/helicase Cas3
MDYPCKDSQGKDTTLLNLLSNHSGNPCGVHDKRKENNKLPNLQQAFMEAGKIFKAIDAPIQAVIVPYKNGDELINQLCAVAKEFDPKLYYELLKKAQKYSVNVFPNIWSKLVDVEAVAEIQEGEGVFYLKQEYYSDEFGLSVEPVTQQKINVI